MKKGIFWAVISGLLLTLSFSRYNLWILAWFGFVPVFWALNNKSNKEAFFLFFTTGIIFWAGAIYWLVHVTLPGTIILIIYLALYFGLFGLVFSSSVVRPLRGGSALLRTRPSSVVFFIPAVWVLLEYIRSHLFTGFPWALLGYSQYLNLPVIQIADITGAWGVSFLIVFVNAAITEIIWAKTHRQTPRLKIVSILLVLFLFLFLFYGYYRIHERRTTPRLRSGQANDERRITISVIQGNIPQELKWDPDPRAKYFIIDRYLTLTGEALKDNPDLVIWPEASLPVVAEEEPSFLGIIRDFAAERKINILLGAVTTNNDLYYNSALLVSRDGALSGKYDKLHLVPFGEYIPLKNVLPFLQAVVPIGEMTPGREYTIFGRQTRFSVLICFEDLFPELSRRFVKNGAQFLVNITNDAWYKDTSAPYQHLQASVFRAVENRAYLARAANTGISGFIAPSGRIISLINDDSGKNTFVQGYKTQVFFIPKARPFSFYNYFGDSFILLCMFFIVYYFLRRDRRVNRMG